MKFGPINCDSRTERLHFQSSRVVEAAVNKLMPVGKFHRDDFPDGCITIDKKYLETMVANWKAMGEHELPIDYFHRGESENDGLSVDEKKAAGWISKLEVRADGLYAETKWTAAAKALIDADELRYFSPTFHPDMKSHADGKRQGPTLLGGALLNDPYFKELPRLAANEVTTKKDNVMDKLKLAALLLIATEGVTEEQIAERIKALTDGEKKSAEALKAAEGQAGALKGSVEAMAASLKATEAKLAALELAAADEKVNTLIARLKKEFRIVAAEEQGVRDLVKGMGLDFATKHYAARPPVVPAGVKGSDTGMDVTPGSSAEAMAKFNALVDEKIKAGVDWKAAERAVRAEHPDVYRLANSNLAPPPAA